MLLDVREEPEYLTGHAIDALLLPVDEITAQEDCNALIHAGWCGVKLLATAHAGSKMDLYSRPVYKPIIKSRLFETLLILQPDKSWRMERIAYEY